MEFVVFHIGILYVHIYIYNLFSEFLQWKGMTELDEDKYMGIMDLGIECSRHVILL